jgi:hypothetical protein
MLLERLVKECEDKGYERLQWWVLDWNTPAIEFYRRMGAKAMDEWTVFRIERHQRGAGGAGAGAGEHHE